MSTQAAAILDEVGKQAVADGWHSYPAYKPSGISWLDQIPNHWVTSSLRHHTLRITDGSHISPDLSSEDELFVSTVDIKNGEIDFENCLRTTHESYEYLVRTGCKPAEGDVLFSKDGTIGRTTVVKTARPFVVASSLVIITPRQADLESRFCEYWLNNSLLQQEYELLLAGAALRRISVYKVSRLPLALPPLSEQRAIASFLDVETSRIDTLLKKKELFIELLQEKRTALINHAVTKGINPAPPLKDSGVDWLGQIPEDWDAIRTRYLCEIDTGGRDTQDAEDEGEFPFFVRSDTIERISTWSFDGEGVLTSGDGVGVGKVFHHYIGKMEIHQRVYLFHNFRGVLGRYFYHFLKANLYKVVLEGAAKSTVDSLRRPMLQDFPIAVPPLDEQAHIVEMLDSESAQLNALLAKVTLAIERLREYRTALISAAVTGKIDVREEAS